MKKVLFSEEGGIMGYENIASWEASPSDGTFMLISEASPSGQQVRFALIYSRILRNTDEITCGDDMWFIITRLNSIESWTINTKAPVVISNGKIKQIISNDGVVNALLHRYIDQDISP